MKFLPKLFENNHAWAERLLGRPLKASEEKLDEFHALATLPFTFRRDHTET